MEEEGYEVRGITDPKQVVRMYKKFKPHCVVSDIKMPGMDGIELLRRLKKEDPYASVIIITAYASLDSSIEALRAGAMDYLIKPFRISEFLVRLKQVLEKRRLIVENVLMRKELKRLTASDIVGTSKEMRELLKLVEKVARVDSTVLIIGESGVGKELIARAIHYQSRRGAYPFVAINCGALAEGLLESELFGYKKGAFTGADADREGLFCVASGGTVFLDEISNTSPNMQVKLLRVLQEKELVPVGGREPVRVDVRVIAATNVDLEELVRAGKFREDLYYRLNVIPIRVPPLRERREDIPVLVDHFLRLCADRMGLSHKCFSKDAMRILTEYDWPGNVRELENVVERAVVLCEGDEITPDYLPHKLLDKEATFSGRRTLEEGERGIILRALRETGYNINRAAKILGIHRTTLYRKMKRYGLSKREI